MSAKSPKAECEEVMESILPLAKDMLARYGEFYPYGGFMTPSGEIVHVGGKIEGTEHPKSQDVIDLLREKSIELARNFECKAVAIVFDVRIKSPGMTEKSDAIQVCLDHESDYSVEVIFPYSLNDAGQVTYGKVWAQRGKSQIFA